MVSPVVQLVFFYALHTIMVQTLNEDYVSLLPVHQNILDETPICFHEHSLVYCLVSEIVYYRATMLDM